MTPRGNAGFAIGLVVVIGGMVGLSFASVPLYRAFCAATGYGGTPNITVEASPGAVKKLITVRFDANENFVVLEAGQSHLISRKNLQGS